MLPNNTILQLEIRRGGSGLNLRVRLPATSVALLKWTMSMKTRRRRSDVEATRLNLIFTSYDFRFTSTFLSIPFDPDLVQLFAIGTRCIYAGAAIFASHYAIYEFFFFFNMAHESFPFLSKAQEVFC